MSQREFRNFWESPRKSWYDKKINFRIDFEFWGLAPLQGSRWRAIRVKKSPCEGWLHFLVGQKWSSSRLVILKSRPMSPPAYFLHLSFMKMSISCTCLLKSIVSVKYFESDFLENIYIHMIQCYSVNFDDYASVWKDYILM